MSYLLYANVPLEFIVLNPVCELFALAKEGSTVKGSVEAFVNIKVLLVVSAIREKVIKLLTHRFY